MPIHERQQTLVVLECDECGRKHQLNDRDDPQDPPQGWTNVDGVVRCPRDSRRAEVGQ